MTLPEQLRAIADRLEAAEQDLLVAQADLWRLAGALPGEVVDLASDPAFLMPDGSSIEPDSAVVPVAAGAGAEGGGGTSTVPSAPIEQAGPPEQVTAGPVDTPVAPVPPDGLYHCPDCPHQTVTLNGLKIHRGRVHGGQKRAENGAPPVIRRGTETFLCSRCPMRFESRDKLDTHLLLDHPDTTPRRLPVGQAPPRSEYEATERILRGGGLGE